MSTAVRAGTDRDAFMGAAAGQAMDGLTERLEIADHGKPPTAPFRRPHIVIIGAGFAELSAATVPDLSARRPADHRARQCARRDLYRIEAITDRNFRFPMGATVVNGDTVASGALSAQGNHPMNRNLFSDTIALRANAIAAAVES